MNMQKQSAALLIALVSSAASLVAQAPAPASTSGATATPSRGLLVQAGEKPAEAHIGCGSIRFLVDSEDTGGAFSVNESVECGRPLTGLHRHHAMDEAFYVIDGQLTVVVDGRTHTLGPGSYLFVPRGAVHAQGNPGCTPNKILVTFTPGGFERLLKDRGEILKTAEFGSPAFRAAMQKWEGVFGENVGPSPIAATPCPPQ